mmetsp:Transcript_7848/g.11889  ORF Transcript_7848/g.11889 Transcript_7848/m.11889 type:complete len:85 (-) Transcript_7848:252-506(-)
MMEAAFLLNPTPHNLLKYYRQEKNRQNNTSVSIDVKQDRRVPLPMTTCPQECKKLKMKYKTSLPIAKKKNGSSAKEKQHRASKL